jgi:Secretion system C-terminal sorting domain
MGNGGTTTGDPTPGSITTVQRTPVAFGCATERDWRCLPYVLSCEFISFKAVLQSQRVQLDWAALCRQEIDYFIIERSTDRSNFTTAFKTQGSPVLNEVQLYNGADDISGISSDIIYYRLKSVMKSGRIILSNIIAVKRSTSSSLEMRILPNPISDQLQILISTVKNGTAAISIIDGTGRTVYHYKENLQKGSNTITYTSVNSLPEGMYYVRVQIAEVSIIQKFSKVK